MNKVRCARLRAKLKKAAAGFDAFIDKFTGIALKVTTKLKEIIDSPVADILTAIIPGNLDTEIVRILRSSLDEAIDILGIVKCVDEAPTLEDKLQCLVTQLQGYSPAMRNAVLMKLASTITAKLDGQRYDNATYDAFTQAVYTSDKIA